MQVPPEESSPPAGPYARVRGEPLTQVPDDLYIPPDALEVILESFEGPLDLLWYLIRRQNLDILDIPVAAITDQYLAYIDMMESMRMELAAEYLVMAAYLAEIKSRMLLPRAPAGDEAEEPDPRADLVRRLQEYERFRRAAEALDALPRCERDVLPVTLPFDRGLLPRRWPEVQLDELLAAWRDVLLRAERFAHHHVTQEWLSVRERMAQILDWLRSTPERNFSTVLRAEEGRRGVVVSLLAVLELGKEGLVEIAQDGGEGEIRVRRCGNP